MTPAPDAAAANLAAAQDQHARTRPDAEALIDGPLRLTHAQLAARIARAATQLRVSCIAPRQLIGVALGDHATHVILMLALARIGAVLLPLDHRWTVGEQERVARHFGADAMLVEAGHTITGARNLTIDDAWLHAAAAAPQDAVIAPGGSAPLLVSLSSGTTGRPKGPRITHAHFLARFRTHWINMGFVPDDCFVCATPLYFGGGRTFVWSTLYAGGKVVLAPPPFDPPSLLATLEHERASTLFLVPTQLRRLLAEQGHARADAHADTHAGASLLAPLMKLRMLISSGAPLTRDERLAIRAQLNPRFCEYYASTEGGGVTQLKAADIDAHADSVGRAIHGVEIEIVDAAHRALPAGTVGRLRYRSPGCASGFYRDDTASNDAFHDGWFYPGDLARLDAEGFLTLAGRAKDMIIRAGINIYPEEIEAVLRAHPAVHDAAVTGIAAADRGEEIAAFVVLRPDASEPVVEALRAWCSERLAPYKQPRVIEVLDALPRNSSGKVQKALLAERANRA